MASQNDGLERATGVFGVDSGNVGATRPLILCDIMS